MIPNQFAKAHQIDVGSIIDLEAVRVVKPKKRRRYTMDELLKGYKPEHRREEWDVGPPVGKKIW